MKIHTDRAVVVEGRYDRLALERFLDALVLQTDGFGIFQNHEKQQLIRCLAQSRGLIVLTDSDSAGRAIRGFLNGLVPPDRVINLYVPDLPGKEKRKKALSKEGKLGVEGIPETLLRNVFLRAEISGLPVLRKKITATDLYNDGFSGRPDSSLRRVHLQKALDLPAGMSSRQLLDVLNCLMTPEEYRNLVLELNRKKENEK